MPGRRTAPRLVRRADRLAGFWFLSTLVAALGPVLFVVILTVDKLAGAGGVFGFLYISPDSARTILGSIAGSLITIASLTSSLTIVTLQLLSNQYTPRAVRGFLRRRVSQVVSGAFIGIFAYCLLMLVAVREPGDFNQPFVPSLGVLVAIIGALVGLALLVFFIHRLSLTIQVSTMTAAVADETIEAMHAVHDDEQPVTTEARDPDAGTRVYSHEAGYVRRVVAQQVAVIAREHPGLTVEIVVKPGDFVTPGQTVMTAWSREPLALEVTDRLAATVLVGHERDLDQDPSFGVRQLVDIALRALSPGINDPTTAVTCLGYLRWFYVELAGLELPGRHDVGTSVGLEPGTVVHHGPEFADYLRPLAEIGTYAADDARVLLVLLRLLAEVGHACPTRHAAARHGVLREVAEAQLDRLGSCGAGDADLIEGRGVLDGLA